MGKNELKLDAKRKGDNIIISKDSFELILSALAAQKFVNEYPPNGDAMAMGEKSYKKAQNDVQDTINSCYRAMENLLYK